MKNKIKASIIEKYNKDSVLPTPNKGITNDCGFQFESDSWQGSGADEPPASRAARLVADLRQLLTLKQHYYPEGGWGWVVLVCAVLVHILSHGLVTSAGLFYTEIIRKFGTAVAEPTGRG